MGYTLKIGEAEMFYDITEDWSDCGVEAKIFKHDAAPAFDEPTDHESQRWPSYTSWSNFARFVGLHDLFFSKEDGLIRCHPGIVPLTKQHKEIIDIAFAEYKKKYPKAIATYGKKQDHPMDHDESNPEENNQLCRFEWLKYWVDWTLENCEKPVFQNS